VGVNNWGKGRKIVEGAVARIMLVWDGGGGRWAVLVNGEGYLGVGPGAL